MAKSLSKLNKHHPKVKHTITEAYLCDNLNWMISDYEKQTVKYVRLLFDEIADSAESECEENESDTEDIDYEQ